MTYNSLRKVFPINLQNFVQKKHWPQINRGKKWEELNCFFLFFKLKLKNTSCTSKYLQDEMHHEGHEKQPSESELYFQVRFSVFKTHNGCLRWGPSPHPLWPALGATWSPLSHYAWSESSWQPCRDCQSNAKVFWVGWGHIQSLPNWLHHIDVWLRQRQWHQLWGRSYLGPRTLTEALNIAGCQRRSLW